MSQNTSQSPEFPRLQPPGAGLPFFQKILLRWYWGPFVSCRTDWDEDSRKFGALSAKALAIADSLDESRLQLRVLVPPQVGLEDSSRYWSVAMTLEHLLVVGNGLSQVVRLLSNGQIPDVKVDVAKVKPKGESAPLQLLEEFRKFASSMPALDSSVQDRQSGARLTHPWFGPMTAHQWHWLLAQHTAIHYRQLREIVKRVDAGR